ncbi:MAG TPA: hypothetical protein VN759_06350, partial [Pseudolysinimonas sp.]|nr:hypothetical protein [Pseudolysinimonas sp.]
MVRARLVDAEAERAEREARAGDDLDVATGLVAGAEVLEVSADVADAQEAEELRDFAGDVERDAAAERDSAERRQMHVEGLPEGPDREAAAAAWKRADIDQARHPHEALQGARKSKSPRPRVQSIPDR